MHSPQILFAGSKNQEQRNVLTNYFIMFPCIIIIKDATTIDYMIYRCIFNRLVEFIFWATRAIRGVVYNSRRI